MQRLIALLIVAIPVTLHAAEPNPQALNLFEQKIRPALVEHCYKCHSDDAAKNKKLRGGLLLDSKAGWATGGDSGPAIVPGKPKESLLMKSLHYTDDLQMPPTGKLSDALIKDFESWILAGAPDPRTGAVKKQVGLSIEEGKKFWSYIPVQTVKVPQPQGTWAKTDLDRFILAKLEAEKLAQPHPQIVRLSLVASISI